MTTTDAYLLGHQEAELRRLTEQAALLAPATDALLTMAGIEPGMRVLDLGTGAGDVAFLVARRVGSTGSVVGVDRSADALGYARLRADRGRLGNVSFLEGDVRDLDFSGPFDAVVGRLVLLYVDDPATVVRRWAGLVRTGGILLSMEYEMAAAGTLPETELSSRAMAWLLEAFRCTGHDPSLGARLGPVLAAAGLHDAVTLGIQAYLAPDDPGGPQLLASTLRTLLPVLTARGIATAEDVDIDTLQQRLFDAQRAAGAMMKPPTLVGAWARRSD